ncbi:MAG: hypothetical protein IIA11_09990 [Proteobacteria bacterium]|nr:hypothetical protein [Pseudomonadota bacterium]
MDPDKKLALQERRKRVQDEKQTQAFRRAIELGDDDSNTQVKLSKALMMQGDDDAAQVALEESMRLDSDRKLLVKAFKLEESSEIREAEKIYRDSHTI